MCGIGARRKAEDVISSGRVRVNGKVVLLPGYRIEPGMEVSVDGKAVHPQEHRYLVMNKPAGLVCAVEDAHDPTVLSVLPSEYRDVRLFPVGRLDKESEGLLILTNDGAFAQEVLHPSKRILREYEALLDRAVTRKDVRKWMEGAVLDGRLIKPVNVLLLDREPEGRWVSVVLAEGVKREVRRMADEIGCNIVVLVRKRIGKMELKNLQPGHFLEMSRGALWYAIRSGGRV
jgi:23S rRNA pseudouridine2605 synthase